jgi:hypothetical protein
MFPVKNSPTDKSYIFKTDLNFEEQQTIAIASLKKFFEGGLLNAPLTLIHSLANSHLTNGRFSNGNTSTII